MCVCVCVCVCVSCVYVCVQVIPEECTLSVEVFDEHRIVRHTHTTFLSLCCDHPLAIQHSPYIIYSVYTLLSVCMYIHLLSDKR